MTQPHPRSAQAAQAASGPFNILLMLLDDVGQNLLRCYDAQNGYEQPFPYANTPNLDRLAALGVRFTQARVSPRFQTPVVAVWTCALASFVTALWAGFSQGIYEAITTMSTVALYASYVLPIVCAVRAPAFERGPWHLGRWSGAVRWAAIAWTAFILVLFVLPPNEKTGYASAALLAVLAAAWFGAARKSFVGPKLK